MNWNMIYLLTANHMPMGERLGYALRMLIVGLGMVFVVLAILWGVLTVSRFVFYDLPRKKREAEISEHKAEAKTVVAPAPSAPAPVAAPRSDDALIAVITAAIAAAMAEEGTSPATGFRVVSFRRTGGNHAWNRK